MTMCHLGFVEQAAALRAPVEQRRPVAARAERARVADHDARAARARERDAEPPRVVHEAERAVEVGACRAHEHDRGLAPLEAVDGRDLG